MYYALGIPGSMRGIYPLYMCKICSGLFVKIPIVVAVLLFLKSWIRPCIMHIVGMYTRMKIIAIQIINKQIIIEFFFDLISDFFKPDI